MPLPPVPREKQISESVVTETRDLAKDRQTNDACEPCVTGRSPPDRDRAVDSNEQSSVLVDRMQPPAHVINARAKSGQRVRFKVDIAKRDRSGLGGAHQPIVLPVYSRVTHWAFCIIPNREL
jgi:hypothetical protein